MRGRGLKLIHHKWSEDDYKVALHAGAWIETVVFAFLLLQQLVALHAGAWIETISC